MTLTRERVEELRADAEAAASELVVGVEGDVLGALLDAWEELERIKGPMRVDAHGIPRSYAPQWPPGLSYATETVVSGNPPPGWEHSRVPHLGDPGYFHAPLTATDEDRIVARCLREVVTAWSNVPSDTWPATLGHRADALDGGAEG